jgi:hypothetical protein
MLKSTHIVAAAVGGFVLAAALAPADANALTLRSPEVPLHVPMSHVNVPPPPGQAGPCRVCTGVVGAGLQKKIGAGGPTSTKVTNFDKIYTKPVREMPKVKPSSPSSPSTPAPQTGPGSDDSGEGVQ